jgi:hypothetical protein
MAAISKRTIKSHFARGVAATTTTGQGKALEDLICYVFQKLPGITVTRRNNTNAFNTEEIDVAFWNEQRATGLPFLPNVILVECKNWSKTVGSEEVNWFDTKLRNRGQTFGILVATNGITGNANDITDAHSIIAVALRESRQLIVITKAELLTFADTHQLILMIKEKLCDLAVMGTVL